jgi:hypothetical protein
MEIEYPDLFSGKFDTEDATDSMTAASNEIVYNYYEKIEFLGQGKFGFVQKMRKINDPDSKPYAMKSI